MILHLLIVLFFFFNDTATTEIYTLSLHDALPISSGNDWGCSGATRAREWLLWYAAWGPFRPSRTSRRQRFSNRSEEHTSELQSLAYLVCRLLLEKKKKKKKQH